MCGITGYWNLKADENEADMRTNITRMANAMHARGPDGGGAWIHPQIGIAFGHRRLAIRDLSPAGFQPMTTLSGRYTLTYNGEIYNVEELRSELCRSHNIQFQSTSDTEVILHACAVWGVDEAVGRLNGMFAFSFWDRRKKKLFLVRDRMGIKPLYWGKFGSLFVFGSEIKALAGHSGWPREINRDAVAELMRTCYISAPLSIYTCIEKLRPGHLLEIDEDGRVQNRCYWDPRAIMLRGISKRFTMDAGEVTAKLESLLRDSVKRHMVADVPLGAFLSGGIDSSLVTALMQSQSSRPVKTFSIGFEEKEYNEAPYAKEIARHLGTEHTEEMMTPRQAWNIIPKMAEFYDEPFADSSQLPTYLLSALTRRHVTVALSGDGGDELFAGYGRYFHFVQKYPDGNCPLWKTIIGRCAPLMSTQNWDRLAGILPSNVRPGNFGMRLHAFTKWKDMNSSALYRHIELGHWPDPTGMVIGAGETPSIFDDVKLEAEVRNVFERMQFLDSINYLPDDILVKVDRASMANSLEARVPLIDHRIYEFTWQLPHHFRVRNGQGKWILRKILEKYVPRELFERPKMGFGVPIDHWLRGPLRAWAEELLDPRRLKQEGYINPAVVTPVWQAHLSGESDNHYWLWDVLMFQQWLESKDVTTTIPHAASEHFEIVLAPV